MIKESSWNDTDQTWYVSNEGIAKAKPGSPIAATVTGPLQLQFQINIFYLDPSTSTIHERYTNDGTTWSTRNIKAYNIKPSSETALAAKWHRHAGCKGCPNTLLVVYQGPRNNLQLANGTDQGYKFSGLGVNATAGTGAVVGARMECKLWRRH
jgi:hypothetical protein